LCSKWTPEEDKMLKQRVEKYGDANWIQGVASSSSS
jgi:hypothetical protein